MSEFDQLVRVQLKTMDELLDLQTKLEKYEAMARGIDDGDIHDKKKETERRLREVQALFEEQTKQIIASFEQEHIVSQS